MYTYSIFGFEIFDSNELSKRFANAAFRFRRDVVDFQSIVDSLFVPTCIVSVERKPDGRYGVMRIVAANQKYIDILAVRVIPGESGNPVYSFVPNQVYTEYFPQNINFEDV